MRTWIKNPLTVWTGSDADAAGGLVVAGDKIVELIAGGGTPADSVDQEFDAGELVVLPGLINCHHHFYQTLTRAVPSAQNKALFPWLKALYPVWAKLDSSGIALSTELALAELMLSGCTTTADHHYLFTDALGEAIDIQAEVALRSGMRVVLTRGSMSVGRSQGGLPPDSVVQSDDAILSDSERLISRYHDAADNAFLRVALAPCSPFSVSRELMRQTANLAREHCVRLHTHLAETEDENDFCRQRYGMRPLDFLEDVGWLANDVWLAHGIFFDDNEIARIGAAGMGIAHCPSSNMYLASGRCRVDRLQLAGAAIGLGVDGSASNDCSNLMQEVRQAFLVQRMRSGAPAVTYESALGWATSGGARVLGHENVGRIEVGACADLAFFALDELRFSGHADPAAALVLCGAHKVRHLMIGGEFRVQNEELIGVDVARLRRDHQQAAKRLVS